MFLSIRNLLLIPLALGTKAGVEAAEAPPPENRLEEIVVSGAFEGRKLGTAILGTTILNKEAIQRQLDGSIGETLRRQPGISSTFFGPGASRPIIRGLGGDRIRILDSGLGSIDASSTSPDHATAIEPALAERIEILRGTAMLMYGSSAAGGVVNVMDGRIPNSAPENTFDGAVRYGHTTVNGGDEIVGAFNAQLGQLGDTTVIFHGDALYRATNDYKIPGFAESKQLRDAEAAEADISGEAPEEEAFGTAENSETKATGASAGFSFLFSNGFIGMNVKLLDSSYGVPGGHEHDHDEHDE
ncbi:MAG: TonB-dependent receptor plug domain-containing protein, partial [Kordiimonadaceae bacterium]|nr:TonB-dependent receptor plug domain-containing protein [Kordiimonadaceae bacterium]